MSLNELRAVTNLPTLAKLEKQVIETHGRLHTAHDTYLKADSNYQSVAQASSEMISAIKSEITSENGDIIGKLHPVNKSKIIASENLVDHLNQEADRHKEAAEAARVALMGALNLWNIARRTEEGKKQKVRDIRAYRIWKRYSIANPDST